MNSNYQKRGPPSPEHGFASLLFINGLIIDMLIIPLSRFVVKPLKKLSRSAMQIADGNLSNRVEVTSTDEIGSKPEIRTAGWKSAP